MVPNPKLLVEPPAPAIPLGIDAGRLDQGLATAVGRARMEGAFAAVAARLRAAGAGLAAARTALTAGCAPTTLDTLISDIVAEATRPAGPCPMLGDLLAEIDALDAASARPGRDVGPLPGASPGLLLRPGAMVRLELAGPGLQVGDGCRVTLVADVAPRPIEADAIARIEDAPADLAAALWAALARKLKNVPALEIGLEATALWIRSHGPQSWRLDARATRGGAPAGGLSDLAAATAENPEASARLLSAAARRIEAAARALISAERASAAEPTAFDRALAAAAPPRDARTASHVARAIQARLAGAARADAPARPTAH